MAKKVNNLSTNNCRYQKGLYICTQQKQIEIMYTTHRTFGIGKVESIENGTVTVYFEDEDKTCKVMEKFTKIYSTIEEAEIALNPELTEEDRIRITAEAEADRKIMAEGSKASEYLYEQHLKALNTYRRNKRI